MIDGCIAIGTHISFLYLEICCGILDLVSKVNEFVPRELINFITNVGYPRNRSRHPWYWTITRK